MPALPARQRSGRAEEEAGRVSEGGAEGAGEEHAGQARAREVMRQHRSNYVKN